jgi:hypothetical protein
MPKSSAHIFLILNVIVMTTCSILAIAKKNTVLAVGGLFSILIVQCIAYGLYFNYTFLFNAVSICGGLLMMLAESFTTAKRRSLFAGLPSVSSISQAEYLQLFGRIFLVMLFFGFVFAGDMTPARIVTILVSFVGCVMVVIGFKAKWSAWFLVAFLSISNVFVNNWWSLHQ